MSTVIKQFSYSKGRGRGLLGLSSKQLSKKPGVQSTDNGSGSTGSDNTVVSGESSVAESEKTGELTSVVFVMCIIAAMATVGSNKLLVAMHSYSANPESPGGFAELSIKKGQICWVDSGWL